MYKTIMALGLLNFVTPAQSAIYDRGGQQVHYEDEECGPRCQRHREHVREEERRREEWRRRHWEERHQRDYER